MYKNKGIRDNFQTVAEIEKCKWKYDDCLKAVFFLEFTIRSLLIPSRCLL